MRSPRTLATSGQHQPAGRVARLQACGFTLLELLVSMGILTLLMLLLTQVVSSVSAVWVAGNAESENYMKARLTMDMVTRDLQAAILRRDVPAFFPAGPQGEPAFWTKQEPETGTRNVSLVLYQLKTDAERSWLARHSLGDSFQGGKLSFDPMGGAAASPALLAAPAAEIGPGIIAFRVQFISVDNAAVTASDQFPQMASLADVEVWVEQARKVQTATVTLAVMDEKAQRLVAQTGKLDDVSEALRTATIPAGGTYKEALEKVIQQDALFKSLPPSALASLHIVERAVPLPPIE